MRNKDQKIFRVLFMALFLASTVFGCILAAQGSMTMKDGHATTIAACCDGDIFAGTAHNLPLVLVNDNILQLFLLSVVSLYFFIKNDNSTREYVLKSYFTTRDRYGGFRLFYYFINLFSRGILHSKIY